ncbi:MAG: hypothetical protein JWO62_2801, partial [Acidimicrobiaceae bacterium]|nr:hypothetical protein [Acidimicrobiaceae bacterium]
MNGPEVEMSDASNQVTQLKDRNPAPPTGPDTPHGVAQ